MFGLLESYWSLLGKESYDGAGEKPGVSSHIIATPEGPKVLAWICLRNLENLKYTLAKRPLFSKAQNIK